jgi:hypothetical protein
LRILRYIGRSSVRISGGIIGSTIIIIIISSIISIISISGFVFIILVLLSVLLVLLVVLSNAPQKLPPFRCTSLKAV